MTGYFTEADWHMNDDGDYCAEKGGVRAEIRVLMAFALYSVFEGPAPHPGKREKNVRVNDLAAAKRAVNDTLRMWGVE